MQRQTHENVGILITEGNQILEQFQFNEQADLLLGNFVERHLVPNASVPFSHYDFQLILAATFHLESIILALTNYQHNEGEAGNLAQVHQAIVKFANKAARMYEYLGSYSEYADPQSTVNLFLHAIFNYSLAMQFARTSTLDIREKSIAYLEAKMLFNFSSDDPFEKFVTVCSNIFLKFAAYDYISLLQHYSEVHTLHNLLKENPTISSNLNSTANIVRLDTYFTLVVIIFDFVNAIIAGDLESCHSLQQQVLASKRDLTNRGYSIDFWLADHIRLMMRRTVESSLWTHLESYLNDFPVEYLENLASQRGIITLWTLEIQAIQQGLLSDVDQVGINLPPQCGRTFLTELIIAKHLHIHGEKVIYLTQSFEDAHDIQARIEKSFIQDDGSSLYKVAVLWGKYDISRAEMRYFQNSDVVILSLDKLDAFMRYEMSTEKKILSNISLFVLDNLHLLKEYYRGTGLAYEFIIMRFSYRYPNIKIVWIANQLSNIDDVTSWLPGRSIIKVTVNDSTWDLTPTNSFQVICDPRERVLVYPSGLRINYPSRAMRDRQTATIDMVMTYVCVVGNVVVAITQAEYLEDIVRKIVEYIGKTDNPKLKSLFQAVPSHEIERIRLSYGLSLSDNISLLLLECLNRGIAFYLGDLPPVTKEIIDECFRKGQIKVVVSTLAFVEQNRVPTGAIILPYWKFKSLALTTEQDGRRQASSLSSNLFLSISSKVRQPQIRNEGHIIVINDKNQNTGSSRAEKESIENCLIRPQDQNLALSSPLGITIERVGNEAWAFEDVQRLEAQLVSFLGEERLYVDNQSEVISNKAFFVRETNNNQAILRRTFDIILQKLASGPEKTQALKAGSPYRVTAFGEKFTQSGVAYQTCVGLFEYLISHLNNNSFTFSKLRNRDRLLDRSQVALCFSSIFGSEEAKRMIKDQKWDKVPNFNDYVLEMLLTWLLEEASILTLAIKYWWVENEDGEWERFNDFWQTSHEQWSDRVKQEIDKALLSVSGVCQKLFQDTGSQIMNGFNQVLDFVITETHGSREQQFASELYMLSSYLRYRVTNPISCYIADIGIRKETSAKPLFSLFLQQYAVTYEPEIDWKNFAEWVQNLKFDEVQEVLSPEFYKIAKNSIQKHRRLYER